MVPVSCLSCRMYQSRIACLSGAMSDVRNRATTARGIHLFHTQHITSANPHAERAIIVAQRAEALNDLAIDFDGHQSLSVVVETARCTSLAQEAAFERSCGIGRKSKEKAPQRRDQRTLEHDGAKQRDKEQYDTAQQRPRDDSRETKAHQQAEQNSGRCQRQ